MAAPLRPRRSFNRPHRGQTIVLFALGSLMLMAMLGLAIDAGYDYAQRRLMQNAADAAAQAGAKALHLQKTPAEIQAAALAAAKSNGFDDTNPKNVFACYFIYKTFQTTPTTSYTECEDTAVGSSAFTTAAGVQVRMKETHGTFVMRAVGLPDSGTAAISTAQVQILATVDMANVPFIVCGYQAKKEGGGRENILTGSPGTTINWKDNQPRGSVTGNVSINASTAYDTGWDWSTGVRPPTPAEDSDKFILWGSNNFTIPASKLDSAAGGNSLCNAGAGFIGTIGDAARDYKYTLNSTGTYPAPNPPGEVEIPVSFSTSAPDGPSGQIQGPLGCSAGVMNNCVLILPIADLADLPDGPTPSPSPSTLPEPYPVATALRVRAWGAFWVTHLAPPDSAQENYFGQLIKYYPMQGNGWNDWSRDLDFTGPVVVHLIR